MLTTTFRQQARKFDIIVGAQTEAGWPLYSRHVETGEVSYIQTFDSEAEATAVAATWPGK